MLVSVLIPTYNRASMVREAIQSVLDQTYQDFEIILIDDGSTDDTPGVIASFNDPRIRYFYQQNQGRPLARNHALKEADGDFITFLDSDDLYLPHKLQMQVDYLKSHPSVEMVYAGTKRVLMDGTFVDNLQTEQAGHIHQLLLWGCSIATPSVMMRSEVMKQVGYFDDALPILEDIDYWLRIAKEHEIGVIPNVLVHVRLHNQENLVRDPEETLKYLPYVIEKNLQGYSFIFQRRIYGNLYIHQGLELLNHKPEKISLAWKLFFKGFAYYPFHKYVPLYFSRLMFRTLVPIKLKNHLRKLWR